MAMNPSRRSDLADAGLQVLGAGGSRALTHRAVDQAAGVPAGTCSNYFPRRSALLLALAERVFERLTPDGARLAELAAVPARDALEEYAAFAAERLLAAPDLARALVELRLEASRSAEIREVIGPFLRAGLDEDVAFHEARGLPGGRPMVLMLHHLVEGVVLDHLTVPLDPAADPIQTVRAAARRLR